MSKKKERGQFTRQPGRVLLADIPSLSKIGAGDNLCKVLEHVFSILCSVSGANRLPCFGIVAADAASEVLLPLQFVRGNFSHVKAALEELLQRLRSGSRSVENDHVLVSSIRDAFGIFTRQLDSMKVAAGYNMQLELITLIGHSGKHLAGQLENIVKDSSSTASRKLTVVNLMSCMRDNWTDEVRPATGDQGSPSSEISSSFDTVTISAAPLPLHNYFSSWMLDSGSDVEHMHLLLGHHTAENGTGDVITIKCDLQERLLSPVFLPTVYGTFGLSLDSQMGRVNNTSAGKAFGVLVPVFMLQAVCRVPVDSVCDSIVFGMPLIVKPTSCWRLEWEDLDNNLQLFQALCHQLSVKKEALVVYLVVDEMQGRGAKSHQPPPPRGHFVLLPSPSSSLLLKPLAVSELMLPLDVAPLEVPSEETLCRLSTVLDKVAVRSQCNSYSLHSGLYETLTAQLTKSSAPHRNNSTAVKNSSATNMFTDSSSSMWQTPTALGSKRHAPTLSSSGYNSGFTEGWSSGNKVKLNQPMTSTSNPGEWSSCYKVNANQPVAGNSGAWSNAPSIGKGKVNQPVDSSYSKTKRPRGVLQESFSYNNISNIADDDDDLFPIEM